MKKLIIFLLTTSAFANDHMEYFHRVNENQTLVEATYEHNLTESKRDGSEKEKDSHQANIFKTEYGYTNDISFGLEVTNNHRDSHTGLSDFQIFAKGNYGKLYYQVDLFIPSAQEIKDDNFTQGSAYLGFTGGAQLYNNLGIKLSYTPAFDSNAEDIDDYKVGSIFELGSAYELKLNSSLVGFELNYYRKERNEQDGEPNQPHDSIYTQAAVYGIYQIQHIQVLPKIKKWQYIGDDSDFKASITSIELALRVHFK